MKFLALFITLTTFSISHIHSQSSLLYKSLEFEQAYKQNSRSEFGIPSNTYRNNSVAYTIEASIDVKTSRLKGSEKIVYQNNSEDEIKYLIIKLKQNAYAKGGIRSQFIPKENVNEGMELSKIAINKIEVNLNDPSRIEKHASVLVIHLYPYEFLSKEKTIQIDIDWDFTLQTPQQVRTGQIHDSSYFVGYWFPQMAVYDDVFGWDTEFYNLLHETYNEPSNFDIKLSIANDYMVWSTGTLLNPEEIYNDEILQRIDSSKESIGVIHIITKNDLDNKRIFKDKQYHTWHLIADSVPDFSFAYSNHYVWDAVSAVSSKDSLSTCWVNVAYPSNNKMYPYATDFAKKSVEYLSMEFPGIPFPYPKHTTVYSAFGMSGMEFPMMANNRDMGSDTSLLMNVIGHEIAHSYLPFYVNTNEKMYAWMDEGWVTLMANKIEEHYRKDLTDAFDYMFSMDWHTINDLPLITPTKCISDDALLHYYYARSTFANLALLDIMDDKGIENPLKGYLEAWKGKHPYPYDFFNYMNYQANENLDWFWKPWYFEYCFPDLGIKTFKSKGKKHRLVIENIGKMPLSIHLEVKHESGAITTIHKSAIVWKENLNEYVVEFQSDDPIEQISLGNKNIPDSSKDNNTWLP